MKKIILLITIGGFLVFGANVFLAKPISAANSPSPKPSTGIASTDPTVDFNALPVGMSPDPSNTGITKTEFGKIDTFGQYFSIIYIWLIRFLWGASVLIGLYAGFLYMTSMGNSEAINKAKDLIFGVVFGIVLLFMIEVLVRTLGLNIDPNASFPTVGTPAPTSTISPSPTSTKSGSKKTDTSSDPAKQAQDEFQRAINLSMPWMSQ